MYLALDDIASLFSEHQGIQDNLIFYTVTDVASVIQPRGLFVPIDADAGELSEAIANGAIAAIWDREKKLPHYTPNHFPVFFTSNKDEAIEKLLKLYLEKKNGETEKTMEKTNFKFTNKKLLNKNEETYDIAVMLKMLTHEQETDSEGRE
ncbi:hypothetical protein ABES02_03365 [Neobacillus pocheonensis]|uniref:hypothetical protein n=1 Tax=Neobacillus pocheonensis TaxID=363869 RepID=UPI003D277325